MKPLAIFLSLTISCLLTSIAAASPPEKVREEWRKGQFQFTPVVQTAFLDAAKDNALKKLRDSGKTLPADFLAWIDADPILKTTVYGSRQDPSGILLILRSLEIDLGKEVVRKKYPQLALAMAVVHAKEGDRTNLVERPLLGLAISGDPRKLVDTHAKERSLDLYDHVINFLNDHAPIEEEVVVGYKEVLPELKYDSKGGPIPQKAAKSKKEAVKEKRQRPLRAADVIASAELEKEFNEYMKAHGQTVHLHCGGETRLHWRSTTAKGIDGKGVKEAHELFTKAYMAKGYLPRERDPVPSLAERCAFLIRNNEYQVPADKKIAWPKFPLNAPWPVLTMLALDGQPLREREDIWVRYRDRGEFHGYGEYVGPIAQTPIFLQARRLSPFPFSYGSVQMMLKDGGVCGTMANIAVRSHLSLGAPASTAGQPGHCALVRFTHDAKKDIYACVGGQYATAGDAGTGVHVPWTFGDVDSRRKMIYHQAIAWSVNHGFQSFLDTTVVHTFFKQLNDTDRQVHGTDLLQSAITLSPYNFLLLEDALDLGNKPGELIAFWKTLKPALASGKPGCPADGLYNTTVKDKLFARLAALPVPTDTAEADTILKLLQEEQCGNQAALAAYKVATTGLPVLLADTETAFKSHLASVRNDVACAKMAEAIASAASKIADKKQRQAWALGRWEEIQGKEKYFGHKNHITTDPSVPTLARLAGRKPRPENEQLQGLLDQLADRLKTEIAGTRTPQNCKHLAGLLTVTAQQIQDDAQKHRWAEILAQIITGKEQYEAKVKNRPQTLRDPCADVIAQMLKSS